MNLSRPCRSPAPCNTAWHMARIGGALAVTAIRRTPPSSWGLLETARGLRYHIKNNFRFGCFRGGKIKRRENSHGALSV